MALHSTPSRDRNAYERAVLRFMLTTRTREGLPVVWAETLLREFVEDLGAGMQCYEGDPGEIAAWAMGTGENMGSEPQRLCCHIEQAYRVMVGAFSLGYHPDWLCVPPSPRFGNPRFPAWETGGVKNAASLLQHHQKAHLPAIWPLLADSERSRGRVPAFPLQNPTLLACPASVGSASANAMHNSFVRRYSLSLVAALLAANAPWFASSPLRAGETVAGKSELETDPQGWVDILPDADLKGWYRQAVPPGGKLGREQWHVDADKAVLICDGDGGHDMLLTEKEYGDAVFHFEFCYTKVEGKTGYNSGAYVRNSRDGAIWHQAQFGDAKGGFLFGQTPAPGGKKKSFNLSKQVTDKRVKPAGEWNTMEVTARGSTLTLWVNGAVTCQFNECAAEKGHLGLEGEGYRIEFRNVKVKELK